MDAPLLTRYIIDRIRLTDNELSMVLSRFRPRLVAKNEVLVGKGEVCRHLFFVEKGCSGKPGRVLFTLGVTGACV
jgi:CRP/FNR family transcriptional regulator, cyclic AMP receptor protein